jgi:MEMO1 family protein
MTARIRRAAVAGSWYPGSAATLGAAVDAYLGSAAREVAGDLVALIAPHAGLMYSGPVAAHAYSLLRSRTFEVIVLVGPSHFVAFDGVAVYASGGFSTPFGVIEIDAEAARAIVDATPVAREDPGPHAREHSLEMQLPFIQRLAPGSRIVPALMGYQTAETARRLGEGLASALEGRRALLVASTDLSHFHDRSAAARLDRVVIDHVTRFDANGLQRTLDRQPDHACGGGPAVAVMRAARLLGARDGLVLHYADSADVSGDTSTVVGYLAAAFGTFEREGTGESR